MAQACTASLGFVDTSLRDGNQSLWGAVGITTGMAETALEAIDRVGLSAIDFTSSTNLLMGAKAHGEDPWERISRARVAAPRTPLSAISTGMRFMSWERASETVMRMSLRLMARHGLRRLQIADPMNDVSSARTVARWAKEEGFEIVVAATTFTESPVHTDGAYVEAASAFAADASIDAVYLKDPGGLLTVERASDLIRALREAVVGKPLELHGHCTTGEAPLVYQRAVELGVDAVHTGIGPLSNGTAQPQLEATLQNLDAARISTNLDRDALRDATAVLDALAREQGLAPGPVMPFDVRPHVHQVPGGMMGTLQRQLGELKMTDLLPAVIEEVGTVRAELGYPIMVTPFSQFVGSQALMNVVSQRSGHERYSRLPDEVVRFVLGHFGKPLGPIAPEVIERVDSLPRTRELRETRDPRTLDELHTDFAKRLGRTLEEEELLLRLVMAEDVLESVRSSASAPRWQPRTVVRTAADFLDATGRLPNWTSLRVRVGGDEVSLVRPASQGARARTSGDS
ncbi:MAG: Conserved carboxylase region [Naasia sp.]|nr:Conserved carboxylase region [Naasia sp.]